MKETIIFNGVPSPGLNVGWKVGKGQLNFMGDVLLVQAMFKRLAELTKPIFLGLPSRDAVPEPKGTFDGKTEIAIWSYQRKHANQLLRVDGIIDRAVYQDRNIKVATTGGKAPPPRLMTITLLHSHLVQQTMMATYGVKSSASDYHEAYIADILRIAPGLRQWIP
jgi:hypothetical protein